MADFPSSVYSPRTKQNKAGVVYDPLNLTVGYVEDVTKLDAEVVALETLFGKNDDAQTVPVAGAVLKGKADGKSKWSTEIFISTSGNVGIGTTVPGAKLHSVGDASVYAGYFQNAAVAGSSNGVVIDAGGNSSDYSLLVRNRGSDVNYLAVRGDGNVGIGTTGPVQALEISRSSTYADLGLAANARKFVIGVGNSAETSYGVPSKFYIFDNNATAMRMVINTSGNVGIGTTSPSALLDVNSDILRLRIAKTPATAGAAGNAGDICWDANFIYVCVATNTWKKVAIATW